MQSDFLKFFTGIKYIPVQILEVIIFRMAIPRKRIDRFRICVVVRLFVPGLISQIGRSRITCSWNDRPRMSCDMIGSSRFGSSRIGTL